VRRNVRFYTLAASVHFHVYKTLKGEHLNDMIKLKRLAQIAVALYLLFFLLYFLSLDHQEKKLCIKRGYKGIITNIKHLELNRGVPNIEINNTWMELGSCELGVIDSLNIGDSIVKVPDSDTIILYSRQIDGAWRVKLLYR
jgi:hypothetical protein